MDILLTVLACLLTGFAGGIAVTLVYLHQNLQLRSQVEWERACMADLFSRWERAKLKGLAEREDKR